MNTNKLIVLDFPSSFKFGIDLKYYVTGPNFKGVKDIPKGTHFVYYGTKDDFCNTGFFMSLSNNEIYVKKWNSKLEELEDYLATDEDINRYKENKAELDRYLGTYEMENHKKWWGLSNSITKSLIGKLMPTCKYISSVDQFISLSSTTNDRINAKSPKLDKDGLVELEIKPETKINFTEIPKYLFPSNFSNKTEHMLDKSFLLNSVINKYDDSGDFDNCNSDTFLLGELQFAFIAYSLSYKLDALEQWLGIIDLLCCCVESGLKNRPELYRGFVSVLHRQLEITEDDFADISTNMNKFYRSLKRLFDSMSDMENDVDINSDLRSLFNGLKATLENKYDWDFSEDFEDELPVIVDMY